MCFEAGSEDMQIMELPRHIEDVHACMEFYLRAQIKLQGMVLMLDLMSSYLESHLKWATTLFLICHVCNEKAQELR